MSEENKAPSVDDGIQYEMPENDNDIHDNPSKDIESELVKAEEAQQPLDPDGVVVTSLAEQEAKTGKKIELTEEEGIMMAAKQHTVGLYHFQKLMPNMSVRAVRRVLIALLQLPEIEGEPSKTAFVKTEEHKLFNIGQQILAAKYAILYDHIRKQHRAAQKSTETPVPTEPVEETKQQGEKNE